ncbi:hypothetical protein CHLRE_12g541904v5 [Chlamydomonas reinhardtii]|uniref:F-box domain-containing protein n=1 Tax=Chlamydomonas reinhardtii TaxID=3055 RepID=A0A2K3D6V0_CHLRE|nr:uncharacterized protein CHLRE_12g541904v5 [Chlamydomonas reinhardtii]PNW76254.1 hypothetical protein CHLRE_12g541904v5 [Chlamydomonas reinhardtii]
MASIIDRAADPDALPLDFLRLLFARLNPRDLCAAACTCKLYNELASAPVVWKAHFRTRWRHSSAGDADYAALQREEKWKSLYRIRHKLDASARAALCDLPWPLRRADALSALVSADEDVVDQLLQHAAPPPAVATLRPGAVAAGQQDQQQEQRQDAEAAGGGSGERTAAEAGAEAGAAPALPPPDLHVGRRYWATEALAAVRKQQAVEVMQEIAAARADMPMAAFSAAAEEAAAGAGGGPVLNVAALERGAIAIAAAHYPTADLSRLEAELGALGAELARRMAEQGAAPGSEQALHVLNHLLFGEPQLPLHHPMALPPALAAAAAAAAAPAGPAVTAVDTPVPLTGHGDCVSSGSGSSSSSAFGGSSSSGCPPLVAVAGRSGGVGLCGCSHDDYFNPANSLLPDVLSYRRRCGIPIALATVHLAVAARGGLGGRLQLIGLPTRVANRFIPTGADGGGGGGSGTGGSRELFVDVFSGRVVDWEELRRTLAGTGVAVARHHVRPLTAAAALERMAVNLHGTYRLTDDLACLRLALDLAAPVAEQPRDLLLRRCRLSAAMEDWADAAASLAGLGAAAEGDSGGGAGGGVQRQVAEQLEQLQRELQQQRAQWAARAAAPKVRPQEAVLFPVGTMVQHRVYGYRGLIVDWDPACAMDEHWIRQMGVDLLPGGGRAQPFYRVLVSAASSGALQGAGAGAEEGEGEEREAEGQQRQQGAVQAAPAAVAGAGGGGGDGGGAGGGWRGQVWAPFGGASKLTGLHHKLLAQETYVAQVNIQVLVPRQPPAAATATATAVATATAIAAAEAAGRAATGSSSGEDPAGPPPPPPPQQQQQQQQLDWPKGMWRPPPGATTVSVSANFQIRHPEVGRFMLGRRPGQLRYVPQPALAARFLGDVDEVGGGQCGEEVEEDGWHDVQAGY